MRTDRDSRSIKRPIIATLNDLEEELASLTLRAGVIREQLYGFEPRHHNGPRPPTTRPPTTSTTSGRDSEKRFAVGDNVRFYIKGRGYVAGTIIHITAHRYHIRQALDGHVVQRAPHNVYAIQL
jgi:hypothetical protein